MSGTVRNDLAEVIYEACYWIDPTNAVHLADAVLAYLGGLDPDADGALVAAHLKADRDEIARLRVLVGDLGWLVAALDLCTTTDEDVWMLGRFADRIISDTLRDDVGQQCVEGDTLARLWRRFQHDRENAP